MASDLTRRECCVGLLTLLAGCATLSPQEEREISAKEAKEVERSMGLVRERRLIEYVEVIGQRLAQATQRPEVPWQWSVADDGGANAFALPGGQVYVTRGLLALVNREDELAGVLAHEMAHVVERHAARRVSAATPLAVLFGVPSGLLGAVSPTLGGIVGGAGRVVAGFTLAPYSREQENEADRIGIAFAARAGWDPGALAGFLGRLEQADALEGHAAKRSSFFSTHPSAPDRAAGIGAAAASLSPARVAPIAANRAALVARLEGLVVGPSAAHGIFVNRLFLHPDFDLALQMPADWKTANRPSAAGAIAPTEDAIVLLQVVGEGDDPVAGARSDGLKDDQVKALRRLQISGLPAAALTATTRDGTQVALTWIAHHKRIFRVTAVCEREDWARYRETFERTATSFRPLRPEELARIGDNRLRIRAAHAGDHIAQVVARGGAAWSAEQAAVANGVTTAKSLDRDWPVKVSVSERYRPAGR